LKRWYFFPDELPKQYEDWYELLSESKKELNTYNIDEATLEVEVSIGFIDRIAALAKDGEGYEGEKYVLENGVAVDTLHAIIDEARDFK
jgi:hypothetical protein